MFTGQKIEFKHSSRQSVQRADKLCAERHGELEQTFVYDGCKLMLFDTAASVYASVAAQATLEAMLDFARTQLDIAAPAGDLVYQNAYEILTAELLSGVVVGKAVIEGVRCDHLALRGPVTDLQPWIQEGAQPLPRRMLITTRDLFNAPQYAVTMTRWDLQPRFDDQTFTTTLIAAATLAGCSAPPPPSANAGKAQLMFVHSADDLKVDPATHTLRLVKVNAQTVYFSDRPQRVAGNIRLPDYLKTWKDGRDSFDADPPNATLSVYEPGRAEPTLVVVTITKPVVEGADLVYGYKLLEGQMPAAGGATTLFIDWYGVGGGVGPGFHGVGFGRGGGGWR